MPRKPKTPPFLPIGDLILVEWLDAYHQCNPPAAEHDHSDGAPVQAIGYLVADTPKYIKLGMEMDLEDGTHGRYRLTIGKKYIIRSRIIKATDV